MARKKKTPEPIPMPQRRPTPVESVERVERCGHIDQPLLLLTLLLFPFMKRGMKISRTEGAFLLLLFTAYMIWLVYSAK